jgi:class 3 adenylate cyclase/CHASE3 domain sensor protein
MIGGAAVKTPIPMFDGVVDRVARWRTALHTKLLIGFMLLVILLLGTAVLGLLAMRRAGAQADRIADITDRVVRAGRMEYAITASMHFRAMHLLTGDPANDKKLVEARQQFASLLGSLETTAEGQEREVMRKISEANLRFALSAQQVDGRAHGGDLRGAMKIHLEEEHPISHELEALARDLIRISSERRDESQRAIDRHNRAGLVLLGGAAFATVGLALFLGYVLSWSILRAVGRLDEQMGAIARGEFQHEVTVPNRDEFQGLAQKANDMGRALGVARAELVREHEAVKEQARRLDEMNRELEHRIQSQVDEIERTRRLSSYLAPQIVRAITSGERTFAMANARKQLTMVFADIRGFTAFSDLAEPEEVIAFLNTYLSRMSDMVFRYEGTLDKFLGDGMLVFFNDPVPQPDHAQRAVRMALDMQAGAWEIGRDWYVGDSPLSLGIGISTGYVTVGTIGSEHRMEYTVVGTQVNLAARLVNVAEPGQIIISQRTYELVRDTVDVVEVGPLTVKGFQKPVVAYNVLGIKDGPRLREAA